MKNLFKILILVFFTVLIPNKIYAWEYPSNSTGYPYADSPEDEVDQWNTYTRNCTSYVMWKINQAGVPFHNNPTGPNGLTSKMGNAENWDTAASYIGYSVSTTPSVGNPVNWDANNGGSGSAGHVAWVEKINTNGTVFISEWNYNYGDGNYNERGSASGDHYLQITSSCSSGSTTIQNMTVVSGQTFNCSVASNSSISILPDSTFQNGSSVNLFIN